MTRTNLASLMVLIIGVPAAAAASFFTSPPREKPCFVAGQTAYRVAAGTTADVTVRIDNAAANPSLRMQLVDDPAIADFVVLDDSEGGSTCGPHSAEKTVRIDPAATNPDLTVTLSDQGGFRIYAKSAQYSGETAAALFAAIWHGARKAGIAGREFAARP